MATSLEKLYSKVSETHSLGDLAAFRQKMLSPESRQKFYDKVGETHNLGDYETFEGKVMGAQPVNGDRAVAAQAAQAPSPSEMLADEDVLEGEINRRLERQLRPRVEPVEDIQPATVSPEEKQGVLKSLTEGLTAGMYDVASIPFAITHAVAEQVGGEGAIELGAKRVQNMLKGKAEEHPMAKELQGKNLWDNPEIILDPRFTAYGVGNMVPSFLAAMLPGAAALRFGKLAATAIGGVSAGMMEGANTYGESRERGNEPDEAFKDMMLMTVGSAILNQIGFASMLAKYKGKRLIMATAAALTEGATEYAEEPLEAEILGMEGAEYRQKMKDGLAVIGPAMIMGGAGSTASQYIQKAQGTRLKRLEKDVKTGDLVAEEQILNERKASQVIGDVAKQPFTGMTAEEKTELDKRQKVIDERAAEIETLFAEEEIADKKDKLTQAAALVADIDPEMKKQLDEAAAELDAPKGLEKAPEKPVTAKVEERAPTGVEEAVITPEEAAELEEPAVKEEVQPAVVEKKPVSAFAAEEARIRAEEIEVIPVGILEREAALQEAEEAGEEKAEAVEVDESALWNVTKEEYIASKKAEFKDSDEGEVADNIGTWEDVYDDAVDNAPGDADIPIKVLESLPEVKRKALLKFNTKAKKLWESYDPENVYRKTYRQFLKQTKDSGLAPAMNVRDLHRSAVERALTEGKPVPDNVLADYPDLAPAATKPEAKPAAAPVSAEPVTEAAEVKKEAKKKPDYINKAIEWLKKGKYYGKMVGTGPANLAIRPMNIDKIANHLGVRSVDLEKVVSFEYSDKESIGWRLPIELKEENLLAAIPRIEKYRQILKDQFLQSRLKQQDPKSFQEAAEKLERKLNKLLNKGFAEKQLSEKPAPPVEAAPEQRAVKPTLPDVQKYPVERIAVEQIKVSPGEFQFKKDIDELGVQEPLKGEFDEFASGNLLLWRAKDGTLFVVNGHHRLAKARESGIYYLNAQVVNETDGISRTGAKILGAETNIREGRGTIYDHAEYFRNVPKEQAAQRRDRGLEGKGHKLASLAGDNLYSAFQNRAITPEQALAIVESAGKNEESQAVGLRIIQRAREDGKKLDPDDVSNLVRANAFARQNAQELKAAQQGDLFGGGFDAAIELSESLSKIASQHQKELKEKILALRIVKKSKRLGELKKVGLEFKSINDALTALRGYENEAERWKHWDSDKELRQQIIDELNATTGRQKNLFEAEPKPAAKEVKPKKPPEGLRFARSATKQPATGKTVKFIEDAVKPLADKIAVPVNTVQSVEDLPAQYQDAVKAEMEKGGVIRGFFDPETEEMYLIADNLRTKKEAVKTTLHEVVAHYGLRRVLGKNIDKFYRKELIEHAKYKDEIQGIADRWNIPLEEAAEEMLAGQIEDGIIKPTLMDKLIAAVRKLLKRVGVKWEYTKAEMRILIDDALKASMGRRRAERVGGLAPAFRTTEPQQWYYSQMQETIENKLPGSGTPQSYRQTIESWANKGEFKTEELQWSGLLDDPTSPLQQKGKITKQEVVDWLEANNVRVETVTKGESLADVGLWWNDEGGANEEKPYAELTEQEQREAISRYQDEVGQYEEDATKFSGPDLNLPGGTNYREVLLTLPVKVDEGRIAGAKDRLERLRQKKRNLILPYYPNLPPGAYDISLEQHETLPVRVKQDIGNIEADIATEVDIAYGRGDAEARAGQFTAGHFDEPNVLVHLRLNDRVDADGKKVLFIEEVQSDWHQAGRREGYAETEKKQAIIDKIKRDYGITKAADEWSVDYLEKNGVPFAVANDWFVDVMKMPTIPDAPFKKTWSLLAMKKAIRIAAEEGYDSIAWTTGEQQASRYDLSQQIDRIEHGKARNSKGEVVEGKYVFEVYDSNGIIVINERAAGLKYIEDTVGKEVAAKIRDGEGKASGAMTILSGLDLKVGGEGMKAFYDKMLPAAVNKYVKKWGGRVGETKIGIPPTDAPYEVRTINAEEAQRLDMRVGDYVIESREDEGWEIGEDREILTFSTSAEAIKKADELYNWKSESAPVHSLEITPAMQQAALMGQPLFRRNLDKTVIQKEIDDLAKLLAELPEERNGKSTANLQLRYMEKLAELEMRLDAANLGLKFARREAPDTPEFKKWFGDSKVVDEDGQPLVVYHGTTKDITEFKRSSGEFGAGIYFTENPNTAEFFGGLRGKDVSIYPVYLSLKNPYIIRMFDPQKQNKDKVLPSRTTLERRGHDGVIGYTLNDTKEIVVFNSNQIASVTNLRPTESPDIRFARREDEESRVDKMLKQVETNLPEKGKDELVRHRMSTLIKQKIRNIKTGARLGALDKAEELYEVKQLILEYARKNLPKKDITRGQIKPLLTQVARAKNEKDVAEAFKRIDLIGRTVNEKTLIADIAKTIKRYKPKKKDGRIKGTVLTADEYAKLSDITAIAKLSEDQLAQANTDIWEMIEARSENPEPTAFESEYIYLLNTFGGLKGKSVAQLEAAKDELENLIETGRTKRQVKDEARRERQRKIRKSAIGSITSGREIKTQEEIAATGGEYEKGWFARFDDLNQSFEYLLDKLSRERGAEAMKGFMNKTFMPLVRKARNAEHKYVREDMEVLQNKLKDIWGTSSPRALQKIQAENSDVVDTGIDVKKPQFTKELREQLKEGKITDDQIPTKTVRLHLSQNQAYKKLLEWRDPTLTGSFARMGYTQETIDELESYVNPKVKQWAEWQMREFYPKSYGPTNEIFREMYDIDLPFNMFYTPISRIYGKFDAQDDQLLAQNTNYNSSVLNNHLKSRVKNNRALKNVDGDVVLANHVIEMAHFRAWAEAIGELRSTFSNEKVRNAIVQYHGRAMLRNIDGFINDMARGGIDPRVVDRMLDKLRRNFTFAVLGINLTLIPKQIVSFPAYATNLPAKDFFSGMQDFFKNPRDNVKTLMESEMMQARYHKGFERDIMLAMQRTTQQELAGARNFRDILMFPTKFGDRAAIVMGGWSVYKYHYDNALKGTGPYKKKHTKAEAKEIAILEFEAATSRSQQAGEVEDLPTLMRKGSWTRLFTMFVTAPNAYYRMESQAVRDLISGRGSKKENLKKFAIAHFLLPAMFQFVANGFRWKDDDQLSAAILGSLNGLLIIGSMIERGVQYFSSSALGAARYFFGSGDNPVFDNVNDLYLILHRLGKMTYNKDIDVEDVTSVLDNMASVTSKATGVPYEPVKRMVKGARELIEKPTEPKSYLKAIGYSEYALQERKKKKKSRRVGLRPVKPLRER